MAASSRTQNGAALSSSQSQDQTQSYFHQQRALLVNEIAQSMDNFLTQLNRLNRNLESVIAVGTEFSNVEALWSRFESVAEHHQHETDTGEGAEGEDAAHAAERVDGS